MDATADNENFVACGAREGCVVAFPVLALRQMVGVKFANRHRKVSACIPRQNPFVSVLEERSRDASRRVTSLPQPRVEHSTRGVHRDRRHKAGNLLAKELRFGTAAEVG